MSFTRFKEFLAILLVFTLVLFVPLIILIIFILSSWFWSLPKTLILFLPYPCWIYFDRHTVSQEGRWSDRLRQSSIFTYCTNYFPLTLIKTADLDPKQNYIFGFHPHGMFSFGASGNFATDATHFSTLFPNIRPHLMILPLNLFVPFTREICLNLGIRSASKKSCENILSSKHGPGLALVIVPGGIREHNLSQNDTMILYLRKRKGFVKLALQYGASLVPVIAFGENELYRRYKGIPWGRFLFGHIPLRRPVVTVVGKPIYVNKHLNATSEDIDQLHQEYIQSVEQLFELNKNRYGSGHIKLEIV